MISATFFAPPHTHSRNVLEHLHENASERGREMRREAEREAERGEERGWSEGAKGWRGAAYVVGRWLVERRETVRRS